MVPSDDITETEPYKPLTEGKKRISGRNNAGRMTVRRRGGGAKKLYRKIDFKRDKRGIEARVDTIEYDPNRSARIALLTYVTGSLLVTTSRRRSAMPCPLAGCPWERSSIMWSSTPEREGRWLVQRARWCSWSARRGITVY